LKSIKLRPKQKKDRAFWWERFAVLVSFSAALIALSQTFVMREQLTAADRNKAIKEALESVNSLCRSIKDIPFRVTDGVFRDRNGFKRVEHYVSSKDIIFDANFAKYKSNLISKYDEVRFSLISLNFWTDGKYQNKFGYKFGEIKSEKDYVLRNLAYFYKEDIIRRINNSFDSCEFLLDELIRDFSGFEIRTDLEFADFQYVEEPAGSGMPAVPSDTMEDVSHQLRYPPRRGENLWGYNIRTSPLSVFIMNPSFRSTILPLRLHPALHVVGYPVFLVLDVYIGFANAL
jgi:hypothetical protein